VVDHFSDAVVKNPIVGQKSKNPQLREWHTKNLGRLPGLKFMRTLWVCNISGRPFLFTAIKPGKTPLGLEEAHRVSESPPRNSMRSQRNSDGPWTSSRSRSPRRPKSWQPSPPTKTRSPQATSLPLSAARATRSLSRRYRPALAGRGVLDLCRRGDRIGMLFSAVHESVSCWHLSDMPRQPDDVRSAGQSRHPAVRPPLPLMTTLSGHARLEIIAVK
jgi:hypothetical protein